MRACQFLVAGGKGGGPPAGPLGRGLNTEPSALVAEISAPAGRPSFMGLAMMVTLSPGSKVFALMPARRRVEGPSASKPHSVALPSGPVTMTWSHEWGLVYWNSFTVPFRVTTF